jgi:hypothetical protein
VATAVPLALAAVLLLPEAAPAQGLGGFSFTNSLDSLPAAKKFRRKRFSSYDRTGGNSDSIKIKKGATAVIAETKSAGCIRHIWCTIGADGYNGSPKEHYLRRMVIRMFWDGSGRPSVEAPIGDFFGMGHGRRTNYSSAPLEMSTENGAGFNCWFPMPFEKGCRIEVENQCVEGMTLYYYVDWEQYDGLAPDIYRFHASWHRELTKGISDRDLGAEEFQKTGKNTTGDKNYVILDARGEGHYVGCNINIHNQRWSWYWDWPGEGDDMIFVDGEKWPPEIHGTGTEDYINSAYCPDQKFFGQYHGVILTGGVNWRNHITYYRYHVLDPVPFRKSIRVTIEHGHNNNRSDDWSSTAYWYQKGIGDIRRLPPPEQRLPLETRITWRALVAYVILWPVYSFFYAM